MVRKNLMSQQRNFPATGVPNMERKHIITLTGKPGSGKSSTADRVAELLGYTRYSSGEDVRNFIHEKKITLEEYNSNAESQP
jgi:cytidylate kinase